MSEKPPSGPLARLGEEFDKAQAERRPARKTGGNPGMQQGLALGLRIGVELVTAVVVSVGVGWAIDRWLGTRPWVMLVMFFLGIAAGMLNVYRAVTGAGGAVGYHQRASKDASAPPAKRNWDDEDC
ncbi:MAG TPA: AtpZ/AtpI family protein [Stellaceae bacterium]|nr:AtpZ/AtpI family protein [Stellaceae bacterium]